MNISDEKAKGIMQYLRGDTEGAGVTSDEVEDWLQGLKESLGLFEDEYLDEENAYPFGGDIYEYLDLAQSASSRRQRKVYLEKARFLDPENFDVLYFLCLYEHPKSVEALPYLEELLEREKAKLVEKGYYEKAKGRFNHFRETQPYIRGLMGYMVLTEDCGLMRKTAAVGEEILMLCSQDMEEDGEEFEETCSKLICVYAFLEEKDKMLQLLERMDEEIQDSESCLLPLAILYYKLGEWDRASQYVKDLQKENRHFKKFVSLYLSEQVEDMMEEMDDDYSFEEAEPGTLNALFAMYQSNTLIFITNTGFFAWAKGQLGRRKK